MIDALSQAVAVGRRLAPVHPITYPTTPRPTHPSTPRIASITSITIRCEPVDACVYRYRFLDATVSESCRLRDPKPHAKPLYKSKIMGHPVRHRFFSSFFDFLYGGGGGGGGGGGPGRSVVL